jgi:dTDP-glucose 4,6-dehydratase
MSKVFLITGGAGFIGSSLVRFLINSTSHIVVNVDKLTYAGNLESLDDVKGSERYFFEHADICNMKRIKEICCKYQPDIVMNLAAESHVDRSIDDSSPFMQTNIIGTHSLLSVFNEYWLNMEVKRKSSFRFHHISTDEVYGDLTENDPPFTELSPYRPSSPYSASKASSDHLVRSWGVTYNFPYVISNCSNNYGPFQFPEKLIPHAILNGINGKKMPIYGDGQQIRDWLFVEDHVSALIDIASHGVIGETYNIGGDCEISNNDVVKAVYREMDILADTYMPKHIVKYSDLIYYTDDRPGHDFRYAIDSSKLVSELKWKANKDFSSGIKETVKWYLENRSWWENILSGDYKLSRAGNL